MKNNTSIRNQIIITDNNDNHGLSNLELAAKYSKNEKNFELFKKLLLENKNNFCVNKLLNDTIMYVDLTSSIDVIELLIKYGANINFKDACGWTALMNCAFGNTNSIGTIEFLIENGANVNIKSNMSQTALIFFMRYSSKKDDPEIIKLLIRKGSQINHKNRYCETALMNCFDNNSNELIRYDLIKILLDNKADIYIKNYSNKNILNIIEDKIGRNSDIYSLVFNYKNIKNDYLCKYDINLIYKYQCKN